MSKTSLLFALLFAPSAAFACADAPPPGNLQALAPEVAKAVRKLKTPDEQLAGYFAEWMLDSGGVPVEPYRTHYLAERRFIIETKTHLERERRECKGGDTVLADGHRVPPGSVTIVIPGGERLKYTNVEWHLLFEGLAVPGAEADLRRVLNL